jgi:hypothetical protein
MHEVDVLVERWAEVEVLSADLQLVFPDDD